MASVAIRGRYYFKMLFVKADTHYPGSWASEFHIIQTPVIIFPSDGTVRQCSKGKDTGQNYPSSLLYCNHALSFLIWLLLMDYPQRHQCTEGAVGMAGAALILAASCPDLRPDSLLYMRKTHLPKKGGLIPSALYASHLSFFSLFLCVCVCV